MYKFFILNHISNVTSVFLKSRPVVVPVSDWFLSNPLRLFWTNQNTPVLVARSSWLESLFPSLEGCKVYLPVSLTLPWDWKNEKLTKFKLFSGQVWRTTYCSSTTLTFHNEFGSSFCRSGQREHVSTLAIGVWSERFLSAFVRADTLGSWTMFNQANQVAFFSVRANKFAMWN